MRLTKLAVALALAALAAGSSQAYVELIDFDTVGGGLPVDRIYSHAFENVDTVYAQLWGGSSVGGGKEIVKLTRSASGWDRTVLMDTAAWTAASGASGLTTFHGFNVVGNYVQFADSSSDAVWRVDKMTGAVNSYVSEAAIQAHTGQSSAQLLTPYVVASGGETIFYEGQSDSILMTIGPNSLFTLVSEPLLTATFGNSSVSGGMALDPAGNLFWGNNTSDSLAMRSSAGMLSWALTTGDITAVTGEAAAGIGAMKYGGDGRVYFNETTSDTIMTFNPADPAGSLNILLTNAELVGGPAGSDSVGTMSWFDKGDGTAGVTWAKISGTGGIYFVPEPGMMALFALGAVGFFRRSRRG